MIWLAREYGMTPRRLLCEMTSRDVAEQMAYDRLTIEDAEAARTGRPAPSAPLPSQEELRRKIEATFRIKD